MSNDENTPIESMEVEPELPLVPSASSEAADTTAQTVHADDIFEGTIFRDFHHLASLRVDGSSTLKDAKNPDLVEKYKYDYVVFKCQHGPIRDRGTGQRNTGSLKLNCKSKLRLRLNRATMTMKVSVWIPEHNHVCAPSQVNAKGRRILPEVIPYTPKVWAPRRPRATVPLSTVCRHWLWSTRLCQSCRLILRLAWRDSIKSSSTL